MGFGIKTDYINGRKLDLNKSYRLLIKPVVEAKGLECVRADEITHSGSIDIQMYRELLKADLVIADISTANPNAIYELGIRHALRPFTTIVISEDKLVYPFDLNHILITSYQHLGDAIDYEEVERFRSALGKLIDTVIPKREPDSPVYTYLNSLIPPKIQEEIEEAIDDIPKTQLLEKGDSLSIIIQEAEDSIEEKNFAKAKALFQTAVQLSSLNHGQKDLYLVHRLAFTTYKTALPDFVTSLYDSLKLLEAINLAHTNDPETVSSAGAIEKKLFENGEGDQHLENSILLLQRSYYLLNNRYNAINLALTYVYRACSDLSPSNQEKIADLVFAQRTWRRVLFLCDRDLPLIVEKELKDQPRLENKTKEGQDLQEYYNAQKFWIAVNQAEAFFGLGDFESYQKYNQTAKNIPHPTWMWESFSDQLAKLRRKLIAVGGLVEPSWTAPV
jgi:hypothetical protein